MEACFCQQSLEFAGVGQRGFRASLGHQDHKLVAAVAETKVLPATEFEQTPAGVDKQFAAYKVTMRVVHKLEAVEVKECEAYRQPQLAAALQLAGQNVVKVPHI